MAEPYVSPCRMTGCPNLVVAPKTICEFCANKVMAERHVAPAPAGPDPATTVSSPTAAMPSFAPQGALGYGDITNEEKAIVERFLAQIAERYESCLVLLSRRSRPGSDLGVMTSRGTGSPYAAVGMAMGYVQQFSGTMQRPPL